MGGAIAKGLSQGSIVDVSDITCTAKTLATLQKIQNEVPGINISQSNSEAVKGADIRVSGKTMPLH